jgi:predicted dehydrogenase
MPTVGPVKIAVLGTGSAGCRHLKAIGSIPGVEPVAIPVRSSRLAELEEQGQSTAASLQEAAADGVKLAVVATDTSRHAKDTLCALSQGFDVLVEKPMAVDAAHAHLICEQTEKLGRQVFVGCVLRFSQALQTFRELLPAVGPLHSVRIECQSYLPDWHPHRPYRQSYSARSGEGGVLLDLIHEIDYAGWIFGWPVALQGNLRNLGRLSINGDEVGELTWETSTGCIVSIHLDYLSRPSRRRMKAYGGLGTIDWDGLTGTVQLMLTESSVRESRLSPTGDEMFAAQIRALVNSINGEHDPQLATGAEGVKALAICDAARLSSLSRREEMVAYP